MLRGAGGEPEERGRALSADLRLAEKALRARWGIDDDKRKAIRDKALELIEHHDGRVATQAVRVLVAMDEIDLREASKPEEARRTVTIRIEEAGPDQRRWIGDLLRDDYQG